MMRLTILLLFFASFLQAQSNFLNATFKVDSSSFVSDYTFILHGKVNGIGYGGNDAVIGDRLIFMKDDTCGELAVDSILGASTFYLRVQVSSIDSIFDAAPFGVGVLSGKTVNNEFRSSTINASNDLINCIENRFKLEVDNIDITLPDSLARGRGTVDRFAYWNTDSTLRAAPEIVRSGGNLLLAAPLGLYSWTTGGEPSPVFGLLGMNSSVGRPEYYNGTAYKRLIGGNVTQNYLMRADAAGDAVNANIIDDGTLVSVLNSKLFLPAQATTVGQPTGSTGGLYYNTTDNALRLFNGTIYQNIVAGGVGNASQTILPSHGLVFQNITTTQRNALPVNVGQMLYNSTTNRHEYYSSAGNWRPFSYWDEFGASVGLNSIKNTQRAVHIGSLAADQTNAGFYVANGSRVVFGEEQPSGFSNLIFSAFATNIGFGTGGSQPAFLNVAETRMLPSLRNRHFAYIGTGGSPANIFQGGVDYGVIGNQTTNEDRRIQLMVNGHTSLINGTVLYPDVPGVTPVGRFLATFIGKNGGPNRSQSVTGLYVHSDWGNRSDDFGPAGTSSVEGAFFKARLSNNTAMDNNYMPIIGARFSAESKLVNRRATAPIAIWLQNDVDSNRINYNIYSRVSGTRTFSLLEERVKIGGITGLPDTTTAQLEVVGQFRNASTQNDTLTRIRVEDTAGNVYWRDASTIVGLNAAAIEASLPSRDSVASSASKKCPIAIDFVKGGITVVNDTILIPSSAFVPDSPETGFLVNITAAVWTRNANQKIGQKVVVRVSEPSSPPSKEYVLVPTATNIPTGTVSKNDVPMSSGSFIMFRIDSYSAATRVWIEIEGQPVSDQTYFEKVEINITRIL